MFQLLKALCIFLILASCAPKEVEYNEFVNYIQDEDNGLHKQAEMNGIVTELTYKPTDIWVHLELGESQTTQRRKDSLRRHYNNYHYFTVSLSKDNKEALHSSASSMMQYSELVQTLSFRMNEYVTLTTSAQDTIPVGDFSLDRTYGLSSATSLLFVFTREKTESAEWLQFNLNEFGLGTGNQRFRFKNKDLLKAPSIKFNTIQ